MSRKLKLRNAIDISSNKNHKECSCLLTISVGQDYHENERFISTVSLVNDNFKSCKILVVDTLQRYTISLSSHLDPEYLSEIALREGDLWMLRNEKYYSSLVGLDEIIRWDRWLHHDKYNYFHDLIESELKKEDYYSLFSETINSYLDRYILRLTSSQKFNRNRAYKICMEYIQEECAAYCLWAELNCDFELYPVKRNAAMLETYKRFVFPQNENLYPLDIQFSRGGVAKPQQFDVPEM